MMSEFMTRLKKQAEDQPILALGVAAAFATALSRLLDANTQRSYAKTHAREVERRINKSR